MVECELVGGPFCGEVASFAEVPPPPDYFKPLPLRRVGLGALTDVVGSGPCCRRAVYRRFRQFDTRTGQVVYVYRFHHEEA